MNDVTVVIISHDRWDLLKQTIDSFMTYNDYPIENFIIIEDSGKIKMKNLIEFHIKNLPIGLVKHYLLIFNEKNIGLIESIDKAYSYITTPYVFHSEDDYLYYKSDFIQKSIAVLNINPNIMQVWIRGMDYVTGINIEPEVLKAGDVEYRLVGSCKDNWWHGFCFQCGLRKMSAYERIKPFTQWSLKDEFITSRECKIGEAYHKLGYRAAILTEGYARHTGYKRSTFGLLNT